MSKEQPTTERLAQALQKAGASDEMVQAARKGTYDEIKSSEQLVSPRSRLILDATNEGLPGIVKRALNNEFDPTPQEIAAYHLQFPYDQTRWKP